jgi:hypothetical protein
VLRAARVHRNATLDEVLLVALSSCVGRKLVASAFGLRVAQIDIDD